MEVTEIKYFVEAALLAAGRPLTLDQLQGLFDPNSLPEKAELRNAVEALQEDYKSRGVEVVEVASGFRLQVRASMADRLDKLWEERPPRYSRALFETLALVAYRQPMTRGEIEEIRGVSVSANIIRTLLEREWIRVVGHRDVPGRPAMFGTTRQFLDYFGLKKLEDLPPLADLSDWESLRVQLDLPDVANDEATGSEDEASQGAVVTPLRPPAAEAVADEDAVAEDVAEAGADTGDDDVAADAAQAGAADSEAQAEAQVDESEVVAAGNDADADDGDEPYREHGDQSAGNA